MQRLANKKRERETIEKSGFYSGNIQRSNDKLKLKVKLYFGSTETLKLMSVLLLFRDNDIIVKL